ncbi:MAG: isocitrate/isopropylmalate dehydrogenase family protein [Candidatus Heimdallarchaeota archaeon]|nr:isocitrate/isopropylmalate dehydrogenase family protein [Candidatus Heimdallarchaeota archaeon]
MGKTYKLAIIPGDGIGKEIVPQAIKVLNKVSELYSFNFEYLDISGGAQYYLETGREWDEGSFEICRDEADAILLGAVGWPGASLPDGNIAGAGIVFGLRFGLDLYANVRPTKLYPGIKHKIHGNLKQVWEEGLVDLVTIRENTEGLYTPIRGSLNRGGVEEVAIDTRIITEKGSKRVINFAFNLAMRRDGAPKDKQKRVTCVDKSNVLQGDRLFRKIYNSIAKNYPAIATDYAYIDAYLQWLIRDPDYFDVIVTSNMFGDISSDLAAVLGGSLGMAPSGNIGDNHALFESVHGSAPKHAGLNKANPIATILSAGMMLDYLGLKYNDTKFIEASKSVETAVTKLLLDSKTLTYDLGGTASCSDVGDAVTKFISNSD